MSVRSYMSIGEVLNLLKDEFPDITISKIRFLESQGLIDPERTPSGYRKFYPSDVERLRFILREQREHFLPLKVIKERLGEMDSGAVSNTAEPEPKPRSGNASPAMHPARATRRPPSSSTSCATIDTSCIRNRSGTR